MSVFGDVILCAFTVCWLSSHPLDKMSFTVVYTSIEKCLQHYFVPPPSALSPLNVPLPPPLFPSLPPLSYLSFLILTIVHCKTDVTSLNFLNSIGVLKENVINFFTN